MIKPEISVLTSCYNASEFLAESIDSILGQTFENFEYILVDDGSADNTLDIIKTYARKDNRIIVVHKENSGLADSLNVGLQMAKGEWIARLDADDIATPQRLECQYSFVKERREIILVGTGCLEIDREGKPIRQHIYPSHHSALMNHLERMKAFFPHPSAFYSKRHALQVGGYRKRFDISQDIDLWFRMGTIGAIGCLSKPLIKLRSHSLSLSRTSAELTLTHCVAAAACHFRRKAGLSDPAQMDNESWDRFLKWIEQRLIEEKYFEDHQTWQTLRTSWYSTSGHSLTHRTIQLIRRLIERPPRVNAVRRRFFGSDIAGRLAVESTEWLPE